MKLRLFFLLLIGFLLVNNQLIGSSIQSKLDSIFQEVKKLENDSLMLDELALKARFYRRNNSELSNKILDTIEYLTNTSIKYEFIKGNVLLLRGNLAAIRGQDDALIEYCNQSIEFYKEYITHPNEEIRKTAKRSISNCYNNMADVYTQRGDYLQSYSLYKKSLMQLEGVGSKTDYSTRYYNIGMVLVDIQDFDSATYYVTQSHILETELNDPVGLYFSNYGFGRIEFEKKNFDGALNWFIKAKEYASKASDKASEMEALQWIAEINKLNNDLQEASNNYLRSLKIAEEIGYTDALPSIYNSLGAIYRDRGLFEQSVMYYEKNISISDSLNSNKVQEKLAEFQAQFDNEKKLQKIALLEKDKKIQQSQKNFLWGTIAGVVAILGLVFYSFLSSRKSNKQLNLKNKTIEARNMEINQKNLQITDSINYAQKIQNAIFPTIEQFKRHFEDAFIFYKPKDIVSGDFYWGYSINNQVIFTAADCTGHGVPGAFMSLIGSNILDKIVGELNIIEPNKILDQLSTEIYTRLSAENPQKIKDGMDLSVCSIDKNTLKLQVAGAYNPVYLVRNNELIQFKPDKLQIGNPDQIADRKFNMQEYQLQKGDTLYLFSDGFPDQKGGPEGKKFFYPPFRELLAKISSKPMDQQHLVLKQTITNWMGEKEQQDDMLILGVKI